MKVRRFQMIICLIRSNVDVILSCPSDHLRYAGGYLVGRPLTVQMSDMSAVLLGFFFGVTIAHFYGFMWMNQRAAGCNIVAAGGDPIMRLLLVGVMSSNEMGMSFMRFVLLMMLVFPMHLM